MKVHKFYEYAQCTSCRQALKFLANNRYAVERIDIFTTPPSLDELKRMLTYQGGNIRALFNTAGRVYQEKNLKETLPKLSADEALKLLAADGKLIRRPFLLTDKVGLVGFKKEVWQKALA